MLPTVLNGELIVSDFYDRLFIINRKFSSIQSSQLNVLNKMKTRCTP